MKAKELGIVLQSHFLMGVIATQVNVFEGKLDVDIGCNPIFLWESLLQVEEIIGYCYRKMISCCNPIFLWESLLPKFKEGFSPLAIS